MTCLLVGLFIGFLDIIKLFLDLNRFFVQRFNSVKVQSRCNLNAVYAVSKINGYAGCGLYVFCHDHGALCKIIGCCRNIACGLLGISDAWLGVLSLAVYFVCALCNIDKCLLKLISHLLNVAFNIVELGKHAGGRYLCCEISSRKSFNGLFHIGNAQSHISDDHNIYAGYSKDNDRKDYNAVSDLLLKFSHLKVLLCSRPLLRDICQLWQRSSGLLKIIIELSPVTRQILKIIPTVPVGNLALKLCRVGWKRMGISGKSCCCIQIGIQACDRNGCIDTFQNLFVILLEFVVLGIKQFIDIAADLIRVVLHIII